MKWRLKPNVVCNIYNIQTNNIWSLILFRKVDGLLLEFYVSSKWFWILVQLRRAFREYAFASVGIFFSESFLRNLIISTVN